MSVEEQLARIEADIARIEGVVNVLAISKGLMCPRCGSTKQSYRKKGCASLSGDPANLWHQQFQPWRRVS